MKKKKKKKGENVETETQRSKHQPKHTHSVCEGIVEFEPHAKDTINYAIMMIELLLEP